MKKTLALVAVAVLTACAQPDPVRTSTPYNAFDYDYHRGNGPNTVTGQAFLRQAGGGLVTCAGTTAALFPASDYFREVLAIHESGRAMQPEVPVKTRVNGSAVKSAICDAQGNFAIPAVPAGRWILAARVQWFVGREAQGGPLSREVEVVDGGANRFILSDNDRK